MMLRLGNIKFYRSIILRVFVLHVLLVAYEDLSATSIATVTPVVMAGMDPLVSESSGLDFAGGGYFWTHNDGYGDNYIYCIGTNGVMTSAVNIPNAVNWDWEDLAHDVGRNYLYIGDFGNNSCDRTNLRVYRISYPVANSGSSATADEISFSYLDQSSFPSPWMNFDAEAFFHYGSSLYIFSKADSTAIGYTKLYRIPDQPGAYVATLLDSFYTNDRITSADINEDSTAVVLLANNRIHLFTGWAGDDFFTGSYTSLRFSTNHTQKEAITFYTRTAVWLSDEDDGSGNFLYAVDLSSYVPATTSSISETMLSKVAVFPNPADDILMVTCPPGVGEVLITLYDLYGRTVVSRKLFSSPYVRMEISEIPEGYYQLILASEGNGPIVTDLIINR